LKKEALEVRFDGAGIHLEMCRDFGVAAALEQQIGDLAVPQTEMNFIFFVFISISILFILILFFHSTISGIG